MPRLLAHPLCGKRAPLALSNYTSGLLARLNAPLVAWLQQLGPISGTEPLMQQLGHHTVLDVSRLAQLAAAWGADPALLTTALGVDELTDNPEAAQGWLRDVYSTARTTALARLPYLPVRWWFRVRAVHYARQAEKRLLALNSNQLYSFAELNGLVVQAYSLWLTHTWLLQAAMHGPRGRFTRLGGNWHQLAQAHSGHHTLRTDLKPLRLLVAEVSHWQRELAQQRLPQDAAFRKNWQRYFTKHGHKGLGVADIALPRLREQAEAIFALLQQPDGSAADTAPTAPTTRAARAQHRLVQLLTARAELDNTALMVLAHLRARLLQQAGKAAERRLLPDPQLIWLLTPDELEQLEQGSTPPPASLWQQRQQHARLRGEYHFRELHWLEHWPMAGADEQAEFQLGDYQQANPLLNRYPELTP